MKTFHPLIIGSFLLSIVLNHPLVADAAEIWITPNGHATDTKEMFKADAQWQEASKHTKVFKFYGNQFFNHLSPEEVKSIVEDLDHRNISIAVEEGIMDVDANPKPPCGGWGYVEGYAPAKAHALVVSKVKQAGGVISYVAMDEPLFYGHYFNGRPGKQPGCHSTVEEVAKLTAPSIKAYTEAFPHVVIGDIEPSGIVSQSKTWREDLLNWATAFKKANGRPLGFLHIDVVWDQASAAEDAHAIYDYARELSHKGLIGKVGVIYNGLGGDPTDEVWAQHARDNMNLVEEKLKIHPDQAIIQSWARFPDHNLPESDTDSLTGLVKAYASGSFR